jgi:hypothetical protein
MSDEERKQFPELKDDTEREFIRIDSCKVNITKRTRQASWFELVDVPLGNATETYPHGDHWRSGRFRRKRSVLLFHRGWRKRNCAPRWVRSEAQASGAKRQAGQANIKQT